VTLNTLRSRLPATDTRHPARTGHGWSGRQAGANNGHRIKPKYRHMKTDTDKPSIGTCSIHGRINTLTSCPKCGNATHVSRTAGPTYHTLFASHTALVEALRAVAAAHAHVETCDMPEWLDAVEAALTLAEGSQQ
jgi:hypothetical protein